MTLLKRFMSSQWLYIKFHAINISLGMYKSGWPWRIVEHKLQRRENKFLWVRYSYLLYNNHFFCLRNPLHLSNFLSKQKQCLYRTDTSNWGFFFKFWSRPSHPPDILVFDYWDVFCMVVSLHCGSTNGSTIFLSALSERRKIVSIYHQSTFLISTI